MGSSRRLAPAYGPGPGRGPVTRVWVAGNRTVAAAPVYPVRDDGGWPVGVHGPQPKPGGAPPPGKADRPDRRGPGCCLPYRSRAPSAGPRHALDERARARGRARDVREGSPCHDMRDGPGARARGGRADRRRLDVLVNNAGIWLQGEGRPPRAHFRGEQLLALPPHPNPPPDRPEQRGSGGYLDGLRPAKAYRKCTTRRRGRAPEPGRGAHPALTWRRKSDTRSRDPAIRIRGAPTTCPDLRRRRWCDERFLKRRSPEDETASELLPQRLAAPESVCSRGRPEELHAGYGQDPPTNATRGAAMLSIGSLRIALPEERLARLFPA